jgi:integrase
MQLRDVCLVATPMSAELAASDISSWFESTGVCGSAVSVCGENRFPGPNQRVNRKYFRIRKSAGMKAPAQETRGRKHFPKPRMATMTEGPANPVFIGELVEHFRKHELIDLGEEGKAYSTRHRCNSVLNKWILPSWQDTRINDIRTIEVEGWLRGLSLARGTKAKIRKTLNLLFNHAIRWELATRNPISGPVRGSGVRQSEKRERIPDVLTAEEFRKLEAALPLRERVLVCLALATGLRRGELAGLCWRDIDFQQLTITVERSVVDQVVGRTKTELSQRPLPMDSRIAMLVLRWRSISKFVSPEDYVFATDSNRAGRKRGKQPVWLAKIMQYRIQPIARAVGITKRIGWHTLRHSLATALHRNGEEIKVVQELLRHSSCKITLDVYAQAVNTDKRMAQRRVLQDFIT